MPVSRRRFVRTAAVGGAATTVAPLLLHEAEQALAAPIAVSTRALPATEAVALQRMAFGPRPGDLARVKQMGLAAYIDEQLNPAAIDDSECDQRLAAAKYKMVYGSVNELRSVADVLAKNATDLWPLVRDDNPFQERNLPWQMVRIAALIRAVYSKRQLQEVMLDFWHDHFNVRPSSETNISIGFPEFDRILRKNCFGNFRAFLEEVGRSVAMLYDLDNASNMAGGGEAGNENYARELFELQTLGSDNYLKFTDQGSVDTITYNGETFPRGYVDDDVYEAARCFTGWTVSHGNWPQPTNTPKTGAFLYLAAWHDEGIKIVLKKTFRTKGGEQDGRDVYDLLARHPGTARHICEKLVRRLISDDPPTAVVDAAVAKWMETRDSADQIKQVIKVILNSDAFKNTWGSKIKRPFEFVAAYLRATEADLPNDVDSVEGDVSRGGYWNNIFWTLSNTGHRLYEWPTPTGHPDRASYWANSNGLLRSWNMLLWLGTESYWAGNCKIDLIGKTTMTKTCAEIVDFWIDRMCGFTFDTNVRQGLIDFLAMKANGGDPTKPPAATKNETASDPNTLKERLTAMVNLLAMSPDFLRR